MANRIRTGDPRGFNKRCSSKFRVGSRVRQTPEESRRAYRPKCCGNNTKNEDNCPKTLKDKNHQALFQKFRQLISYINHQKYFPTPTRKISSFSSSSSSSYNYYYYYCYFFTSGAFFRLAWVDGLLLEANNKFLQVSGTIRSILANNNAVWMVSIRHPI